MRNLIAVLLCFLASFSHAQIDTVCFASLTPSIYSIPPPTEGSPQWTITGGTIISGQGTNTIQVSWSSQPPGLIVNAVRVTLIGTNCPSPVQSINVFVFKPIFSANFSVSCPNSPCLLLSYPNTIGEWSGNYVSENIFCPPSAGNFPVQFTGTYFGCLLTVNGNISVGNFPTLGPISWQ